MMNSCYTFLTVTACAVLYMSKDAKAMVGSVRNVGKVGSRVQSTASMFGGVKSDTINYGSIGQPQTGASSPNYLAGLRSSTGTLDRGSRLPQTGSTGTGGFSSGLTGSRTSGSSRLTSSVKINVGGDNTQFATSKLNTQTGGSVTGGLGATVTSKGIGAGTSSSSRLTASSSSSSSSVRKSTLITTSSSSSSSSFSTSGGVRDGISSSGDYGKSYIDIGSSGTTPRRTSTLTRTGATGGVSSSSSRLTASSSSSSSSVKTSTLITTSELSSSSSSIISGGTRGGVGSSVDYGTKSYGDIGSSGTTPRRTTTLTRTGATGGTSSSSSRLTVSSSTSSSSLRVTSDGTRSGISSSEDYNSYGSGGRDTLGRRGVSYTSGRGTSSDGERHTSTLIIDFAGGKGGGKAIAKKVLISDSDSDTDEPPKYRGYTDPGYGQVNDELTKAMKDLEDLLNKINVSADNLSKAPVVNQASQS